MKIKFALILFLSASPGFTQGFGDYISKNALEVDAQFNLNPVIYKNIEDCRLIMVGERHGTLEPAKLVESLASYIVRQGERVSVGLEIPADEMKLFLEFPTDSTLKLSQFFMKENLDGRKGKAWFDLIRYCNSEPRVKLFFFDNHKTMQIENRDSAMYLSVVKQLDRYPDYKVITLSGNIHNWMIPYNNKPTMGSYCLSDNRLFPKGTIRSINHVFSEGTMLNSSGNGLELKTVEFQETVYSSSTDKKNYLLFYETAEPSSYNCIFYTRKVNQSEKIQR